jgi:hypothetical protein
MGKAAFLSEHGVQFGEFLIPAVVAAIADELPRLAEILFRVLLEARGRVSKGLSKNREIAAKLLPAAPNFLSE